MRSSYTMFCKFCDKKWTFESKWLPVEVLESYSYPVILAHCIRHHREELTKERLWFSLKQIFITICVLVLFVIITFLKIITYPLYWLLEKLYEL